MPRLFMHARFPTLDAKLKGLDWTPARTADEYCLQLRANFPTIRPLHKQSPYNIYDPMIYGQVSGEVAEVSQQTLDFVSRSLSALRSKLVPGTIKIKRTPIPALIPIYIPHKSKIGLERLTMGGYNKFPLGFLNKTGKRVRWVSLYPQFTLYSSTFDLNAIIGIKQRLGTAFIEINQHLNTFTTPQASTAAPETPRRRTSSVYEAMRPRRPRLFEEFSAAPPSPSVSPRPTPSAQAETPSAQAETPSAQAETPAEADLDRAAEAVYSAAIVRAREHIDTNLISTPREWIAEGYRSEVPEQAWPVGEWREVQSIRIARGTSNAPTEPTADEQS